MANNLQPLLILLSLTLATAGFAQTAPTGRYQALWIDAFHEGIRTPQQTIELVETARRHRFNALFVQVSKGGDAFFDSRLAPRAAVVDPGYDPLKHLIQLAHDTRGGQHRLEVHAWLIAYRVSTTPALPPGNLLLRHPEWRMLSRTGEKSLEGRVFGDPGVPGVQQYYIDLAREVARNYAIDGVHLDRIRYPGADWGYNQISLQRFQRLHGVRGAPKADDPRWCAFRRDQINQLVKRAYVTVKQVNPRLKFSASVVAEGAIDKDFEKTRAYQAYFQNWPRWVQAGWLDLACPMIYKRDHVPEQKRDYDAWCQFAAETCAGRHLIVGQASYLNSTPGTLQQIEHAMRRKDVAGVALYSYAAPNKKSSVSRSYVFSHVAQQSHWRNAAAPPAPWIARPSRGVVAGELRLSGRPADGLVVQIQAPDKKTYRTRADGNGFFALVGLTPGECLVSVEDAGDRLRPQKATVAPGKIAYLKIGS